MEVLRRGGVWVALTGYPRNGAPGPSVDVEIHPHCEGRRFLSLLFWSRPHPERKRLFSILCRGGKRTTYAPDTEFAMRSMRASFLLPLVLMLVIFVSCLALDSAVSREALQRRCGPGRPEVLLRPAKAQLDTVALRMLADERDLSCAMNSDAISDALVADNDCAGHTPMLFAAPPPIGATACVPKTDKCTMKRPRSLSLQPKMQAPTRADVPGKLDLQFRDGSFFQRPRLSPREEQVRAFECCVHAHSLDSRRGTQSRRRKRSNASTCIHGVSPGLSMRTRLLLVCGRLWQRPHWR